MTSRGIYAERTNTVSGKGSRVRGILTCGEETGRTLDGEALGPCVDLTAERWLEWRGSCGQTKCFAAVGRGRNSAASEQCTGMEPGSARVFAPPTCTTSISYSVSLGPDAYWSLAPGLEATKPLKTTYSVHTQANPTPTSLRYQVESTCGHFDRNE